MKKLSRILLVLLLVMSLLPVGALAEAAAAEDVLAVHYQNDENNYEDLGIWFWGDVVTASEKTGAWPGGRTLFEHADAQGASLKILLAPEAREVGVLVIDGQGTKLTPEDLMIELASPRMRQVWINNRLELHFENQREIPEGHLRVRFFRESEDYTDMGVWFWGDVATASEKTGGWPTGATPMTAAEGPLGAYVDIELAEGAREVGFLFVNRENGEQTADYKLELDGSTRVIYMKEGDDSIRRNPYQTEAAPPETARDIIPWQQKDADYFTTEALGTTLHEDGSATLRLWAPTADQVEVVLYAKHKQDQVIRDGLRMEKGGRGVWQIRLDGRNTPLDDLEGAFYHFRVTRGSDSRLVLDPYARSMAAWNSQNKEGHLVGKAAIVAPERLGPELAFAQIPGYKDREDAIIYELHVRDFTVSPFLDGKLQAPFGTFKALEEKLDYLKDLGVTHIQLLPVLNYYHVNETDRERNMDYAAENQNYNWGYDPQSYFALTGMYATDPKDPGLRVKEFKELVAAIHEKGLGVILDVVYNHTAKIELLEDIEPHYYYFMDKNGKPKGSFGGGQMGSTHLMTRRLIVDSLVYLTDTYKVDGFRFDMMGNLDLDTILEAHAAVSALNPDSLWIGEGWRTWNGDAGVTGITPADQDAMDQTDAVAVFSDEVRNELKSGFGSEGQPRFLTGGKRVSRILFENAKAQPSNVKEDDPGDIVQYIAAHDNLTLHDVIAHSIKKDPALHEEEILKRLRLGNAMLLTHQGIIFLHAGQEYGRTKQFKHPDFTQKVDNPPAKSTFMTDEAGQPFQHPYFIHDSYDSSDAVNMFDWETVETSAIHRQTKNYTAGLIALRRSTDAFSYADMAEIDELMQRITFKDAPTMDLVLAYAVASRETGDVYVVVFNADETSRSLDLSHQPLKASAVHVLVDAEKAGAVGIKEPVGVAVQVAEGQLTGITLEPLTATVVLLKNP